MAFVIARPLNLLLSWDADRLNAYLSDGHTLGRMGQLAVAPQLLSAASTEGWAALQGEPAERERWGRVIFQQLFPPAIGQALSGSPGGLLQLQLSDALLDIPWVWPPERTCRDLAGLEILMGFRRQTSFSQPTQS